MPETGDPPAVDAHLPQFAWCRDCWDQAAEGTREERDGLPATCEQCGGDEAFWL